MTFFELPENYSALSLTDQRAWVRSALVSLYRASDTGEPRAEGCWCGDCEEADGYAYCVEDEEPCEVCGGYGDCCTGAP